MNVIFEFGFPQLGISLVSTVILLFLLKRFKEPLKSF